MRTAGFIVAGILFGIIMTKSEALSWYRIQEMFRFQSFHMYGIIGTAVTIGIAAVWLIKRKQLKDFTGKEIVIHDKEKGMVRYLAGGIIFGLGWALTGSCPGPLFVNLGYGYFSMGIVIASAIAGTYLYGVVKDRLPH